MLLGIDDIIMYVQSMFKMTMTLQLFDSLRLMCMTMNGINVNFQQKDAIMIILYN